MSVSRITADGDELREGDIVEVLSGPGAGRHGLVWDLTHGGLIGFRIVAGSMRGRSSADEAANLRLLRRS